MRIQVLPVDLAVQGPSMVLLDSEQKDKGVPRISVEWREADRLAYNKMPRWHFEVLPPGGTPIPELSHRPMVARRVAG